MQFSPHSVRLTSLEWSTQVFKITNLLKYLIELKPLSLGLHIILIYMRPGYISSIKSDLIIMFMIFLGRTIFLTNSYLKDHRQLEFSAAGLLV